jgi:hypothetical protein
MVPAERLNYIRDKGLVSLMDIRKKQLAVVEALEDVKAATSRCSTWRSRPRTSSAW